MALRIISWNVASRSAAWTELAADPELDVALLQEASSAGAELARESVPHMNEPWRIAGQTKRTFCSAIARFSARVKLRPIALAGVGERSDEQGITSRAGTLALAEATMPDGEQLILGSMYGAWESPIADQWIYADASVHRLLSDLSALIGSESGHRILVAGHLNILRGYGENGSAYWAARYRSVFDRMDALGLPFVGPQFPNGRRADPWPDELPKGSANVPTFRTSRGTIARQLDYVFASHVLHERPTVRALNAPEEWGPSDHCRILIELADK